MKQYEAIHRLAEQLPSEPDDQRKLARRAFLGHATMGIGGFALCSMLSASSRVTVISRPWESKLPEGMRGGPAGRLMTTG